MQRLIRSNSENDYNRTNIMNIQQGEDRAHLRHCSQTRTTGEKFQDTFVYVQRKAQSGLEKRKVTCKYNGKFILLLIDHPAMNHQESCLSCNFETDIKLELDTKPGKSNYVGNTNEEDKTKYIKLLTGRGSCIATAQR